MNDLAVYARTGASSGVLGFYRTLSAESDGERTRRLFEEKL